MSAPSLYLSAMAGCPPKVCCTSFQSAAASFLSIDTLVSITCLVVGILALKGVLALPPAAAYSLIGVSSGITLLYVVAIIHATTKSFGKGKTAYQEV